MIGFVSGCFDLLHVGHLSLLRRARALCDTLIVGLNSDDGVEKLKGRRPIIEQRHRQTMLLGCRYVDRVLLFDELTPIKLIEGLKPERLFRGYDETPIEDVPGYFEMLPWGGKIISLPKLEGVSTTVIIELVRGLRR